MIHTFSLPRLLLQSLTLNFDIQLFSPFTSLEQQKGFGRWYLAVPVHFAPNLISSASPSFAPQPPSFGLVHTCVSQFPAITSMGCWGGLEGFGPCQDPGWAQSVLVGIRDSQISLCPLRWGWRGTGGVQGSTAIWGSYFSMNSSVNYLHLVKLLAFMTKF